MLMRLLLFLILIVCACAAGCNDLPRDPKETSRHAQGGHLRVGLVEHTPWVIRTDGEPAGAEVELVRRFAAELGATPDWHWGGEQQQMEALEHYQLDLVVGGVTDETPWSKYVGLTSSYFEERIKVGVPISMQPPASVKGMQVAVKSGEAIASYLESKSALPVRVDDLSQANLPVAAPDWQLEQMGLTQTEIELRTEKHVWAAPPGENGFIKRLDEFLHRHSSEIKGLLQQEVAKR
jgi:polar amino acid transport system substrate-binding protein